MTDAAAPESANTIELAAQIVLAYVARNSVSLSDLPLLISGIHRALAGLGASATPAEAPSPAVSIRKSITPEFLISLEDGRPYKALKRHLRAKYGMSPEQYRAKWDLPKDYPMIAPNYAAARSELAKRVGLGRGGHKRSALGDPNALLEPPERGIVAP